MTGLISCSGTAMRVHCLKLGQSVKISSCGAHRSVFLDSVDCRHVSTIVVDGVFWSERHRSLG